MKLELKHLAPYLPYKLKIIEKGTNDTRLMNLGSGRSSFWVGLKTVIRNQEAVEGYTIYKPILRPLSDLTKEIDGKRPILEKLAEFDPFGAFHLKYDEIKLENIPITDYRIIQLLFECHYDVFGLIPEGLAIDINTLNLETNETH